MERGTQLLEVPGQGGGRIVLAGLRGDRTVKAVGHEHGIAETLYYSSREKLLEGGQQHLGTSASVQRIEIDRAG